MENGEHKNAANPNAAAPNAATPTTAPPAAPGAAAAAAPSASAPAPAGPTASSTAAPSAPPPAAPPKPQPAGAAAAVRISADKMSAHLTVHPADEGGKPISEAELLKIVADAGIVYGLLPDEIKRAAAEQKVEQLLIAEGTKAVDGEPGSLEFLVSKTRALKDDEVDDARKIVDLHDLAGLTTVNEGDPLMRRHPPGAGTPGHDVLGKELAPRPGKDAKFGHDLEGAGPSEGDPDLLVAKRGGLPVIKRDCVSVTDVMSIDDVDLSVGNIDFKGSITIKGSVTSGMHVSATGDIIVGDTIEAAKVDSENSITVKGGIVGFGMATKQGTGGGAMAHVRAKAELKARFIENAVVSADSISVENEVIQSDVTANNQIIVGGGKSGKSAIRGGTVRAGNLIRVPVLGAETSNETAVSVGVDPSVADRISELRKGLDAKADEKIRISEVVELLKTKPEKQAMLEKALHTMTALDADLAAINEELQTLEAATEQAKHAKIEVTHSIQGAVRVTIGHFTVKVLEQRGPGTFSLEEDTGKIRYD